MTTPLDEPDDRLGRQDPFAYALAVWRSLETMKDHGHSPSSVKALTRSMDAVLVRHRAELMAQYQAVGPVGPDDSLALRRELGLEYWNDGELLAENDPEGRMT